MHVYTETKADYEVKERKRALSTRIHTHTLLLNEPNSKRSHRIIQYNISVVYKNIDHKKYLVFECAPLLPTIKILGTYNFASVAIINILRCVDINRDNLDQNYP